MQLKDIVPGHYYKYKGIWAVVGFWSNELVLYGNGDMQKIKDEWGDYNPKLTEEIAAELEEWPRPIIENGRKAKEIALDYAIRNKPQPIYQPLSGSVLPAAIYNVLDEAERYYQWLIK